MATSLAGKDVNFYVNAGSYTNNEYWVAVCAIQSTSNESKAESTVITKCGSVTAPGSDDNSVSLDLTFLTSTPGPKELNARVLKEIYRDNVVFDFILSDAQPSASYLDDRGEGVGTSCVSSYPAEGLVNVAFEFKVNGSITSNL